MMVTMVERQHLKLRVDVIHQKDADGFGKMDWKDAVFIGRIHICTTNLRIW